MIVITIMLQMCDKLEMKHLKKQGMRHGWHSSCMPPCASHSHWRCLAVWIGAFCGLGVAICAAIVFVCLFWVAQNEAFSGSGQTIFEGFMFLIASYLLTIVAFAMLKFKDYEKKLEMKLLAAANVRPVPLHCNALHADPLQVYVASVCIAAS